MKKQFCIISLLFCVMLAVLLPGCDAYTYSNADKYTAGNTEITDPVEIIDIDWSSGEIHVEMSETETVSVTEENSDSLSDEMKLHWWKDGKTLRVRFCSGTIKSLVSFSTHKKVLHVTIPATMPLRELCVDSASADFFGEKLKADAVTVSTASGDVALQCEAEKILLDSSSGKLNLTQTGSSKSVSLDSASGDINAVLEKCDAIRTETSSGKVSLSADSSVKLDVETSSGDISCTLNEITESCNIDTASGKVTLKLPETAGFTAKIKTASGEFNSDLALTKNGHIYTSGDGKAKIVIDTSSGDISILKK